MQSGGSLLRQGNPLQCAALWKMTRRFRNTAISVGVLSLLGITVSAELTRIHMFVHTDPSYRSICAVTEGINCETVAVSPYSVFAGLPVSVWGISGYLLIAVLSFWGLSRRRLHSAWPFGLLLLITSGCVAVSLVLAYLSLTRIDSLCLFCMASYIINLLLFALCVFATATSGAKLGTLVLVDLMALTVRPKLTAALVFSGVLLVVLAKLSIPAYWNTPKWEQLPLLARSIDAEGFHWEGAVNPNVTIVEFSDYECPHCRDAHRSIRLMVASHSDTVRLVHRHLPLDNSCHPKLKSPFHKHACSLAEAAECAGRQGRFWEMNDALFSRQSREKRNLVDPMDIAVRLGLDRSAFKQCMVQHDSAEKITTDISDALKLGLKGTPSFVVNGRVYLGGISNKDLDQILDTAR